MSHLRRKKTDNAGNKKKATKKRAPVHLAASDRTSGKGVRKSKRFCATGETVTCVNERQRGNGTSASEAW